MCGRMAGVRLPWGARITGWRWADRRWSNEMVKQKHSQRRSEGRRSACVSKLSLRAQIGVRQQVIGVSQQVIVELCPSVSLSPNLKP